MNQRYGFVIDQRATGIIFMDTANADHAERTAFGRT